jgi:hypothetical protein
LHKHFRNAFAHFTPQGWSIEIAILPGLIATALKAFERLMGNHNVLIHLEHDQRQRLIDSLKSTRASLGIT